MDTTVARGSILVVDDEPGLRDLLAWELSQDGYEIETAENGRAALAAIRRRKFDLAITDLRMPEMDGVETVAALRAIDPDIEVIVATGYATVETAVSCMKGGAYDYVQKPYDLDELRLLLERAMQKSQLQGLVELYDVSRALLMTVRRGELEPLVLELAEKLLHADTVCLAIIEGRSTVAQRGRMSASPELVEQLLALDTAPGLLVHAPDPRVPQLERESVRSAMVQPLALRDTTLGRLVVMRAEGTFSAVDLQRGSVFAAQVALALHNSRLCEALAGRVKELLRTREDLAHADRLRLEQRLAGDATRDLAEPLAQAGAAVARINGDLRAIRELVGAAREAATCFAATDDPAEHEIGRALSEGIGSRKGLEDVVADAEETASEIELGMRRMERVMARLREATAVTAANVGPTDSRSA